MRRSLKNFNNYEFCSDNVLDSLYNFSDLFSENSRVIRTWNYISRSQNGPHNAASRFRDIAFHIKYDRAAEKNAEEEGLLDAPKAVP